MRRFVVIPVLLLGLPWGAGCGQPSPEALPDAGHPDSGTLDPDPQPDAGIDPEPQPHPIPKTLSGWGLFEPERDSGGRLVPVQGNHPYSLSTELFSDHALKFRTLRLPPGKVAAYRDPEVLDFPVGTVLSKTFAFVPDLRQPEEGLRLYETRILVRQPAGWEAHPYVWNEAGDEALLSPGGRLFHLSFLDAEGAQRDVSHLVPSRNQCLTCHHRVAPPRTQVMLPIGPKARYLNFETTVANVRQDQLQRFVELGLLDEVPEDAPPAVAALEPGSADLEARARTYLDINCAHCHNPAGTAGVTSQLFLEHTQSDPFHLGVCKRPGSTGSDVGGNFGIVPGDHTQSILWYRTQTTESGKMMPQLGRSLSHAAGAQLIADWIDAMEPHSCD